MENRVVASPERKLRGCVRIRVGRGRRIERPFSREAQPSAVRAQDKFVADEQVWTKLGEFDRSVGALDGRNHAESRRATGTKEFEQRTIEGTEKSSVARSSHHS